MTHPHHKRRDRRKLPYVRKRVPLNTYHKRQILKNKREQLYLRLARKNKGHVPCFVCGKHVTWEEASLEHIRPLSKGGTNHWSNLSISHELCNHARGNVWNPM